MILILGVFTACTGDNDAETSAAPTMEAVSTEVLSEDEQEPPYEFEFEDIDGNVHKLSDYSGKPVYLKVWASWCGVCTASLDETDAFAAKAQDFVVLSVVSPSRSGELSKQDFITWYKDLGYDNLVVLLDEQGQIIGDFDVMAYPTQVFFDENGYYVKTMIGNLSEDQILNTIQDITQ